MIYLICRSGWDLATKIGGEKPKYTLRPKNKIKDTRMTHEKLNASLGGNMPFYRITKGPHGWGQREHNKCCSLLIIYIIH